MKTIEQMLRYLARSKVTEFAVASDRLPCIKVDGDFRPIDDAALNTDVILQMLVSAGGSRYVDSLGPKPLQWSTRVDGVGQISVNAMMRDDVVQARFKLIKRDPRADDEPISSVPAPLEEDARGSVSRSPVVLELDAPPSSPDPGGALELAELALDTERGAVAAAPAPQPTGSTFDAELDFRRGVVPPLESPRPPVPVPTPSTPVADFALHVEPMRAPAPSARPSARSLRIAGADLPDLLAFARESHASDVHVVAGRPVLLRIAGELAPQGQTIAEERVEAMVHAVVPPRLAETLDRDGSCDFAIADAAGRARVNVARQRTGYKICARLVAPGVPTLASLGLPEQIGHATHHHQGLILVTGPTGHGKTSTLAAIVDLINRETTHHVITVEDPIEYVHPRKRALMSQREVGAHTKTFHNALKASLREDPDVIVVGELRDLETVRMALSASETGHLVLGTMNTPSAAKTIDRLIDLFPPGDQAQVRLTLAGGLRLIVSQRLLPNAEGNGLVAAAEILPGSVSLWSLIRDNKTYQIPSLQQRGKGLGITRFDDSLAELVKAGRVTLDVARQWAENAAEMEMTALDKRPQVALPLQEKPNKTAEAMGGLINKAGNLFRKGT